MSEHQASVAIPSLILIGLVGLGFFFQFRPAATPQAAPIILWGAPAATNASASTAPLAPTAPAPPPINARVGIQVGHWEAANLPDELATLRTEGGGQAGGFAEVDINYAIAKRVAALLAARGITVDLLPATVPPGYAAQAFVAIHNDYNNQPAMSGYKLARFRDSAIPARDDALIAAISADYSAATGQQPDTYVTRAMTGYYAFNSGAFQHAISPQTPGVIIEMGFLTNPTERALLVEQQDRVAGGIAAGIIRFLTTP